jgi:hypothetical protein
MNPSTAGCGEITHVRLGQVVRQRTRTNGNTDNAAAPSYRCLTMSLMALVHRGRPSISFSYPDSQRSAAHELEWSTFRPRWLGRFLDYWLYPPVVWICRHEGWPYCSETSDKRRPHEHRSPSPEGPVSLRSEHVSRFRRNAPPCRSECVLRAGTSAHCHGEVTGLRSAPARGCLTCHRVAVGVGLGPQRERCRQHRSG